VDVARGAACAGSAPMSSAFNALHEILFRRPPAGAGFRPLLLRNSRHNRDLASVTNAATQCPGIEARRLLIPE
jgi:hypothetical protein